MADRLHSNTRAIIDARRPDLALELAAALATQPPPDWEPREWLTIAERGAAGAEADLGWLELEAYARDRCASAVDALRARAKLIARGGDNPDREVRSLKSFIERARLFVASDSPAPALERYRASRDTVLTAPQGAPAWLEARDLFLRSRRLRELGQVLAILTAADVALPEDLRAWLPWAALREDALHET